MEIGSDKHLLLLLLREDGNTCDIGLPKMAEHIGRHIDTTRKFLKELAQESYVSIEKREGKPSVITVLKKGMDHE